MKKNDVRCNFPMMVLACAILAFLIVGCEEASNVIDDTQKTAALRNVTVAYDSMSYELGLPEGALNGMSFGDLLELDSSKYANPANYTITFSSDLTANNTANKDQAAKFDGMDLDIVMDTIVSAPIKMAVEEFEIKAASVLPVSAQSQINLKTHRLTGLYIFQQMVDGEDLETVISPVLKYKIALQEGEITVAEIHQNIPTRASEGTKEFLRGLLESGVFEY